MNSPEFQALGARVDEMIKRGVLRADMPAHGISPKYYDSRRRRLLLKNDGYVYPDGGHRSLEIKQTPLQDLEVFRAYATRMTGLEGEELTAHLRTIRPCHAVTMFNLRREP